MNQEQLNAIKERVAKATPGPWKYSEQYGYLAPVIPQQHVAVICNEISRNDDAEFIALCREDVPALVAEVERLRKALSYYADEKHYEPYCIPMGDYASDVTEDNGEIARQALVGDSDED